MKEHFELTTRQLVNNSLRPTHPGFIILEGSKKECEAKEKEHPSMSGVVVTKLHMDEIKQHPDNKEFFENNPILKGEDISVRDVIVRANSTIGKIITGESYKQYGKKFEWSQEANFIINHFRTKWEDTLMIKSAAFLKATFKKDLLVHEEKGEDGFENKSVCYIDDEGLVCFFLKENFQRTYPGKQRFFFSKDIDLFEKTFVKKIIKNFENEVIGLSNENQTILNLFFGFEK